ncbi:twin transmembrane helix small protein [Nitrosomonas sp.]|uniref:twin transmembrane helix small protein n=1 Tax=Nitrosomonas sp. TaxID=42353 RepID=UPI0025E09A60|nr:twin transmembrane helix small protein [Nitrosomonas sp.]MCC6917122.1 twin transmembrane helix small protein [Nitrosomonas sp.]
MKILAILLLLSILYSLGSAFYYMLKDKGDSTRMVKSLTIRVTLSLVLFLILMLWVYIEYIHGNAAAQGY